MIMALDAARGDVLTLKSLEFQDLPLPEGSLASASILPEMGALDILSLVQTAVLALVALVLGLFVIRPIFAKGARAALAAPEAPLALPSAGSVAAPALEGEVDSSFVYSGYAATPKDAVAADDPAARLRRLIETRQTESIEILRGWMEHDEERT